MASSQSRLLVITTGRWRWPVLAFAMALLAFGRPSQSLEPVYQGRTVSQWFKQPFPDGEWHQREELTRALGTNALPALIKLVGTREGELTWRLRQLHSKLPAFVQARLPMPVEGWVACDRAAGALGYFGTDAAPAVPALIRVLEDGIGSDNTPITLGLIGAPASNAVAVLQHLATRPTGHVPACMALLRIGPAALPAFDSLARHASNYVRLAGRAGQLMFTEQTNEAVATLTAATRDDTLVYYALDYFEALGSAAVPAIPDIAGVLKHPDERVREYCARVLSSFGPSAIEALGPLGVAVSTETFPDARVAQIQAIGAIGPKAQSLKPVVEKFLLARDLETVEAAKATLERIRPSR